MSTSPTPSAPRPPSIHVRAVITWIAIFPLVTLGFFAIAPFAISTPALRRSPNSLFCDRPTPRSVASSSFIRRAAVGTLPLRGNSAQSRAWMLAAALPCSCW